MPNAAVGKLRKLQAELRAISAREEKLEAKLWESYRISDRIVHKISRMIDPASSK